MKHSLSKLKPGSTPLFLDASVVINLAASNRMEEVLAAIGRPAIVTAQVCAEFKRHPREKGDGQSVIEALARKKTLKIAKLSDSEFDIFLRLIGCPPPDDLGDGEASTLACAHGVGCAVIDETKATRIAVRDFPELGTFCSLDILCADSVIHTLEEGSLATAVYDALKFARMRVPASWRNWVCDLIGEQRAAELPALKHLRHQGDH